MNKKKSKDVFEDLKERLDNCAFDEDDVYDMMIKDGLVGMLEAAQQQIKKKEEQTEIIGQIIMAYLLYGKSGIHFLANCDESNEFIKDNLDELLKVDKIEITVNNHDAEIKFLSNED